MKKEDKNNKEKEKKKNKTRKKYLIWQGMKRAGFDIALTWPEFLAMFDANADGLIDYAEFCIVLRAYYVKCNKMKVLPPLTAKPPLPRPPPTPPPTPPIVCLIQEPLLPIAPPTCDEKNAYYQLKITF